LNTHICERYNVIRCVDSVYRGGRGRGQVVAGGRHRGAARGRGRGRGRRHLPLQAEHDAETRCHSVRRSSF